MRLMIALDKLDSGSSPAMFQLFTIPEVLISQSSLQKVQGSVACFCGTFHTFNTTCKFTVRESENFVSVGCGGVWFLQGGHGTL